MVKGCDVHCYITHDQSKVQEADAVVMELVNHYKFFGTDTSLPLPWPERLPGKQRASGLDQHWILFHYEARETCKNFLYDPSIMGHFQLTMTPDQSSDIPVSLICDWGRQREDFLLPPPPRKVTSTLLTKCCVPLANGLTGVHEAGRHGDGRACGRLQWVGYGRFHGTTEGSI